jgi:cytochrome b561
MTTENRGNAHDRYGALSIGLHWLMLLLIAAAFACMELRDFFPKGSDLRNGLKTWHYRLGLAVLVLVALRLLARLARLAGAVPAIDPVPARWQALSATLMHWALYGFMLGLPMLGWLTLSAQGSTIPFFGLVLPPLVAESKATAEWIKEIHETGATVGYFLLGLHAAAALFHHYFVHHNTLLRMLPLRVALRVDRSPPSASSPAGKHP